MNGIDKITERITADVRQEIAEIEAASAQECREIAEKYEKRAQDQYWKAVSAGKKAADQRIQRMESVAAMEAKKQLLSLKQEVVSKAFERAIERMAGLPEDEYVALLAGFAVRGAKTGREQLILSPGDRSHYGKKVCMAANELLAKENRPGELTLAEKTRDIRGGVIVTDGHIDVNYSLEALVASRRNELMEQVAKILFD